MAKKISKVEFDRLAREGQFKEGPFIAGDEWAEPYQPHRSMRGTLINGAEVESSTDPGWMAEEVQSKPSVGAIKVNRDDLLDVRDFLAEIASEADFGEDNGKMDMCPRLVSICSNVGEVIRCVDKILGVEETIYYRNRANDNRIFVFGSNLAGCHGAGAAYTAMRRWGAKYGVGFGPTGKAYAIPTKDENIETLPLIRIAVYTGEFADYAKKHPELTFLVTRIGCGLAGYTDKDIAPLFSECVDIPNVVLPFGWGGRNTE